MSLESYKLTRQYTYSNPRNEMMREKKIQVQSLYELAVDREDNVLLNGVSFKQSPRIFDHKFLDTVHHKITVETILEEDWMECGDYLEYDGMMWLCMNSYSFHKLYCRATFVSCDWQIYWINEDNELVHQYVIDQNSTQYNSGESGNSTITLGAAQHMLKMQCNDNTVMLDSPKRFAIDRNIKKPTCYKVSQNDNSSYSYGKGLCCITVTETQFNPATDKKITLPNGTQVWICDYASSTSLPSSSDNLPIVQTSSYKISHKGSATITAGGNYKKFYATDMDGNPMNDYVSWNVTILPEYRKYILYERTSDNGIKIKALSEPRIIGSIILLSASIDGVQQTLNIEVGGGI